MCDNNTMSAFDYELLTERVRQLESDNTWFKESAERQIKQLEKENNDLQVKAENYEKYYQQVLELKQENEDLNENNVEMNIYKAVFNDLEHYMSKCEQLEQENEELVKELQNERNYSIEDDFSKWVSMQSKVDTFKKALGIACKKITNSGSWIGVPDDAKKKAEKDMFNDFLNEAKEKKLNE